MEEPSRGRGRGDQVENKPDSAPGCWQSGMARGSVMTEMQILAEVEKLNFTSGERFQTNQLCIKAIVCEVAQE